VLEEPDQVAWAYRSPSYRALNLTFGVRSTEPDVGEYLDHVLSGLRCGEEDPELWYSIALAAPESEAEGAYSLLFGSEFIGRAHSKAFAIETLLWHLNGATVDRADPFVVLHAGGVTLEGVGVIISGPSGAGKTTLTAALLRGGFSYLTDEALAIDPATSLLHPYAKALSIKRGSWDLLADLRPPLSELSSRVWHVAPTDIRPGVIAGPTPPSLVLVPTHTGPEEPGSLDGIRDMRRSEALTEVFRHTFGLTDRTGTLQVLANVLAGCACFRVSTVDLHRAVQRITEIATGRAG
jgi:hypothetical protein